VSIILAPSAISVIQDDVLRDFLEYNGAALELPIKIYGPQDQALNNPAPPCIAWHIEEHERWEPGQRTGAPGVPSALWTRVVPVTFEIFGGLNELSATEPTDPPSTYLKDTDRTEALMAALVNSFHRRLTQHGYTVLSGVWGPSTRTGAGMVYLLTVGIRIPVAREDNPTVHISRVNPEPEIVHGS
jgi:hypothetical protein